MTNVYWFAQKYERSYFWANAYQVVSKEQRDGSNAKRGLVYCNLLFAFEDKFRDLPPEERLEKRMKHCKPVTEDFFEWVGSLNALPKSLLGEAVHYALSQGKYLENIYFDGRLDVSNNIAERSIKPFVQGRKQWLFSCTPNGTEASSIFYSIIETAKANNLNPFKYLEYLLENLPVTTTSNLNSLLPWSETLPNYCRVPVKESFAKRDQPKHHHSKGALHNALNKLRMKFSTDNNA